jgi:spermidine synthase
VLVLDIGCLGGALFANAPWDRLSLTSGTNVYFRTHHVTRGSRLDFWHEDASGIVTVVSRDVGTRVVRTLLTNGKFQGNDAGEVAAQIAIALLPCAAVDRRDRALVIGLGTGQSAEVVHTAGFAAVEVAEISRGIVLAAREHFVHVNRGVLDAPGVTLLLEDGRNHLLRGGLPYDLVSIELSSVWFVGVNNLYSREFYALVAKRMTPGAVLQQWIQFHHLAVAEVASVLATVRRVFPFVELWFVGGQGIILASDRPVAVTRERIQRLAAMPSLLSHFTTLSALGGLTPEALAERRLLSAKDVDVVAGWTLAHGVPVNTDTNRFLEYATPRHALDGSLSAEQMAADLARLAQRQSTSTPF